MNERLIPRSDYYRNQDYTSLDRDCAEKFMSILKADLVSRSNILDGQVQTHFSTHRFDPDDDVLPADGEDMPSLRIRQSIAVSAMPGTHMTAGSRGELESSSDEYLVLSLQSADWLDEDYPTSVDDIKWQDKIAVIIKPSTDTSEMELDIVDQQTGRYLSQEELIDLLSLLSVWEERLRYDNFIDNLQDNALSPPSITPMNATYREFRSTDFMDSIDCPSCQASKIPCYHQEFERSVN